MKDSDQFYICYTRDCYESIHVKDQIEKILQSFRYKKNPEFFVIEYHVLKNVLDRCCMRNNLNFEDFKKDMEEENKHILPEPVNKDLESDI